MVAQASPERRPPDPSNWCGQCIRLAALAEEVANLFASLQQPHAFLVHDINFHKAVGAASGNPIVASLMEMVSALYYEQRRETAERASSENLRDAAEAHRRIYQAIRLRDADAAGQAMNRHLNEALQYQKQEPGYPMSASISSSEP